MAEILLLGIWVTGATDYVNEARIPSFLCFKLIVITGEDG